jgi:predicted site-specific integrase-resolvase
MLIATEPNVSPTGRYSVTETCEALGIHRKTLKAYADKGYIRQHHRARVNKVFYLGRDILAFWRTH